MEEHTGFKIVPVASKYPGERFAIVDADGVIVDDAQGYGYKSKQAAHKVIWYKFKGGKDKIASANAAGRNYWRDKKHIAKAIDKYVDNNLKEIARDEVTADDFIVWAKADFGVELDRKMVDWLLSHDYKERNRA